MQAEAQQTMRIVAAFGRHWNVRSDSGDVFSARTKGRRLRPVCGDRVLTERLANEQQLLIVDILPRRNELTRPDSRGRTEILLANIDLLLVVVAEPPKPDWFVVDRYLCAAELLSIEAVVVCNKADLGIGERQAAALRVYETLGYRVLRVSARQPQTLRPLVSCIAGRVGALVGLSGVGKSSIINLLSDVEPLAVGPVSDKSGEGRHTTVSAVMLRVDGGDIIDSPGVRDYAPSLEDPDQAPLGFREIVAAAPSCRYANCRHLREPDCAVKAAVEEGRIEPRRYESYRRLRNLQRQLGQRRR